MPVLTLLIRWGSRFLFGLTIVGIFNIGSQAQEQDLGRCSKRSTAIQGELYVDNYRWCTETVVHDRQIEPLSFTDMEVAPDGTLFATRPLSGQVIAIHDTDGDTLPDAMETFADELTLPNGLAFHKGDLYVAGGANIYRITPAGAVETLVNDLPSGTGFWTGGLAVGDDDKLYVAVGAPCDNCNYAAPERGVILNMNLDGSERQVVATGLRNPADLAIFRDRLWTLDSAPRQKQRNALDELNLVRAGGWYGFPHCLGEDTINIASDDIDCARSVQPVMRFGSGANPTSLAAYPFDVLTGTADTLIVVLSGEPSQVDIVGYKVIMVTFDEADRPLGASILTPYRYEGGRQAYMPYTGAGLFWRKFIHVSEQGWGFYPQQPLAVAVSPQGWIYISMTGGRIIALRPRQSAVHDGERYPIWTPMNPDFDPSIIPTIEDS